MKVLIYTHEYPPFQGGIATSSEKIATIFASEHSTYVCCPKYNLKDNYESKGNLQIHRIDFIGGKDFKKIPFMQFIKGYGFLKEKIKDIEPDLIFYLGEEAEIVGGLLNNKEINQIVRIAGSGIKSILESRKPSNLIKKYLMLRLYRNSKKIIAVSKNTQKLMNNNPFFEDKQKIRLIYNGFDEDFANKPKEISLRKELGYSENDFILLTVSRVLPRKGQDYVIKAISELGIKKIKYICVGGGKYLEKFKSMSRELDIESNILFTGPKDKNEVHKYYDICDIFILCNRTWNSKIEGLPNVAIEAMARKKPVIGSRNSGTEELIVESNTGFKVNGEEIDDIKKKILLAYESKVELKNLGLNAYNMLEKEFSYKNMAKRYMEILNEN